MYCAHMRGGHKAGNMEADLCGVTISVMICGELMVVGVLGGGTTEGAARAPTWCDARRRSRYFVYLGLLWALPSR